MHNKQFPGFCASIWQPSLNSVNAIARELKEFDMSSTQARSEMSRLDMIRLLAVSMLLLLPATAKAQQSPPIAEQIAKAYGLDSFGQIEAIRYTWNAEFPGGKVSRTWEWSPKTDTVSYEGKDKEGPLLISTDHRGTVDGKPLHLSLSDVSVKLTGSDNWINAQ